MVSAITCRSATLTRRMRSVGATGLPLGLVRHCQELAGLPEPPQREVAVKPPGRGVALALGLARLPGDHRQREAGAAQAVVVVDLGDGAREAAGEPGLHAQELPPLVLQGGRL